MTDPEHHSDYSPRLALLRELAGRGMSFDQMSEQLDLFSFDERTRQKLKQPHHQIRNGIDLIALPLLGKYREYPLELAPRISRTMMQWYLSPLITQSECVLEIGAGAGQNAVTLARTFPRIPFFVTDLSAIGLACVDILSTAAGTANLATHRLDLMSPDFGFLPKGKKTLIYAYAGVLSLLEDGGRGFLEALRQVSWNRICLFEPVSDQMGGPSLIAPEVSAARGLTKPIWKAVSSFCERDGQFEKVIPDFCGFSSTYPMSILQITPRAA